jgi:hypothetical protein
VAQLFSLGHEVTLDFCAFSRRKILVVRVAMRRHPIVSLGLGSRLAVRTDRAEPSVGEHQLLPDSIMSFTFSWPNKSPEPTAVGAISSAVAVHAASRRWLSFFR